MIPNAVMGYHAVLMESAYLNAQFQVENAPSPVIVVLDRAHLVCVAQLARVRKIQTVAIL
jgi:hypothetical protein